MKDQCQYISELHEGIGRKKKKIAFFALKNMKWMIVQLWLLFSECCLHNKHWQESERDVGE